MINFKKLWEGRLEIVNEDIKKATRMKDWTRKNVLMKEKKLLEEKLENYNDRYMGE